MSVRIKSISPRSNGDFSSAIGSAPASPRIGDTARSSPLNSREPATPIEVTRHSPATNGTQATSARRNTQNSDEDEKWKKFVDSVNVAKLPDDYRRYAVTVLQQEVDPGLTIPLIITDVVFDAVTGRLKSITVVKKAGTAKFLSNNSGKAVQDPGADVPCKVVTMPWITRNGWDESRLKKIARQKGGNEAFAQSLEDCAKKAVLQQFEQLPKQLATVLTVIDSSMRLHEKYGVEGLWKSRPRQVDLDAAILQIKANKMKFADTDEDAVLLVEVFRTMLRQRLRPRINASGIGNDSEKIRTMLEAMPPFEKEIWKITFKMLDAVLKEQASLPVSKRSSASHLAGSTGSRRKLRDPD